MSYKFIEKYNKEYFTIGAIHLPPLFGYNDFPGIEVAIKNALYDLDVLERAGFKSVIYENNYDLPHKEKISKENLEIMKEVGKAIKAKTNLPVGISVLWNDYASALTIAKDLSLDFIRVPVFVDDVKTQYGEMRACYQELQIFQKSIDASNILLFTDIHVKHAELLSKYSLIESADLAIKNGADALILTGKWTGDMPNMDELKKLRSHVKDFPILLGSGCDADNIVELARYSNGCIVSTSIKEGEGMTDKTNIKKWQQRIDFDKAAKFIKEIK